MKVNIKTSEYLAHEAQNLLSFTSHKKKEVLKLENG